jgi:hypothetical protein
MEVLLIRIDQNKPQRLLRKEQESYWRDYWCLLAQDPEVDRQALAELWRKKVGA